jgi:hypothetical protein
MAGGTQQNNRIATLTLDDGRSIELPILSGTLGPDVVDMRGLSKLGMFTYDPAFFATASCTSEITYIDGEAGLLYYRGYPIEQLAERSDFLEVCYLLLNGELPNAQQKDAFSRKVTMHTMVHDQLARFYNGFRRDAHPMAVMVGVVGALSAFYHDSLDINNPEHREISALRLIAKVPTIAAMAYKYNTGYPFMYPKNAFGYVENFMYMMFGTPAEDYVPNPVLVRALERIFILHADHEQNASTSTVRLAGSSGANPFACVASGARRRQRGCAEDAGGNRRCLAREGVRGGRERQEIPADGFRPPRLQEHGSARQCDAPDLLRGAQGAQAGEQQAVRTGAGAGTYGIVRSVFHRAQAVPERGLLFGHRAARTGYSDQHVHGDLRAGAHHRLGVAMERDGG